MPSLKLSLWAVATALMSAVRADYQIDPDSVSLTLREAWCADEISTCPIICQQTKPYTTLTNTCDAQSLTYGCVCGDGLQPNVSEYSLTLPYFVCQEWGTQCVARCGEDNTCASDCRENHPCGALKPTLLNTTSTTTSDSATATPSASDQIFNGVGATSTATSSTKASYAAPTAEAGRALGLVVLVGSLIAGFTLVL